MGNFTCVMESQKQCIGCVYWKTARDGAIDSFMCHHLLVTGKRRIDQDGVCLSRTPEKHQVQEVKKEKKKEKKKENKVKKKVKAVEDGIVFESMTEAERHYGLAHGRVRKVTNNPKKTARGQHFVTV